MYTKSIYIVSLSISFVAAQTNSIDPNSVDINTRGKYCSEYFVKMSLASEDQYTLTTTLVSWCNGQINTCGTLCNGDVNVNDCNSVSCLIELCHKHSPLHKDYSRSLVNTTTNPINVMYRTLLLMIAHVPPITRHRVSNTMSKLCLLLSANKSLRTAC